MKNFVGIDLGTTNSAICSYDGSKTRIWKSPEQNDVTPSAIFIDRRGNKYIGKRAYDSASNSPDNSAMLFKRLMGTSTPIRLSAVNITKTPEECSAEVLKVLFGYLPEEIRNDQDTGTVITVPAAFNQMQKDATMQAANMADLGKVALMQEPVAAVMSVMRASNPNGMFLIYDLGGGTLDVAVAESLNGRVNLLAHGGIAMCGGRDFDRALLDNVVKPWLFDNFDLPEDFSVNPDFKSLIRLATWATEKAKIELSAREDSVISLSETEIRTRDKSGNEIYLDIPLSRGAYDSLISDRVNESIDAVRETLEKAGLSVHDMESVVFVGGPTNYKPLRDKVANELGIKGNTDVNPMTAVAEGASIFAESIDWSSQNRSRKNTRGQISFGGKLKLSFNYTARTPDTKAKIAVLLAEEATAGCEIQIDSIDTGWTSGRLPLKHGATIDVPLMKSGDNCFKVFAFDSVGRPVALETDKIIITKTAATVDAIPASHSVSIEVLEKLGGRPVLVYLVRSGDSLPTKGKKTFKAADTIRSGTSDTINIKLWEGEIEDSIKDNIPIGVMKISGSDFLEGEIKIGADLICEYEMLDSGNIILKVTVPSIGASFRSGKNFYSRQEGQLDYSSDATRIIEEGEKTMNRINEISEVVDNPKLEQARQKLEVAVLLDPENAGIEETQEAREKVLEARKLIAQVRKEHIKEIRQIDLDAVVAFFNNRIREYARPTEISTFENLIKTAQRSIDRKDAQFTYYIDELRQRNFTILWRQDWYVIERFKRLIDAPYLFADKHRFEELAKEGKRLIQSDDIEELRNVVCRLWGIQISDDSDEEDDDVTNIARG